MNCAQLDPVQVGLKMAELILALEAGRAEAADAVARALGETTAGQLTIRETPPLTRGKVAINQNSSFN